MRRGFKSRTFFLPREAIRPDPAPRRTSCIAADRIAVDGCPVGFMYRDEPDDEIDSGWRFFAGTESQEYLDDPDNIAQYDVNTIANYDQGIVPLLDAPAGSAFERKAESGGFVPAEFPVDPDVDQAD